ncbi:hypothetical protein ACGFY9_21205 [Streptomyces sp. NPDC048504]|uniref:hypothetical protein n=1 Tax=Streptomyces sp. NPDC048504 TaxID=3365559 RepID=UPI0037164FAB
MTRARNSIGTVDMNASLTRPLRTVGALLDASAFHPGRSARSHLRAIALSNGIGAARVDAVLYEVGRGVSPVGGQAASPSG